MLRFELETPEPASQGQCPQATSQQLLSSTCDHISILNSTRPNPGPPTFSSCWRPWSRKCCRPEEVPFSSGQAIYLLVTSQLSAQFSRGQIEHAEPSSGVSSSL